MVALASNQFLYQASDFATGGIAGNPGDPTRTVATADPVFSGDQVIVVTFNSSTNITRIDVFADQAAFDAATALSEADASYWDQNSSDANSAAGRGNSMSTQGGYEGDTFKGFNQAANFRVDGSGDQLIDGGVLILAPGYDLANNDPAVLDVDVDDDGNTTFDAASVPCFVAGTLIRTDRGEVPVERIRVGDRVLTLDNGYQPVRWCGARMVAALGADAPVEFAAGVLGNTRALRVSPYHRVLWRDWRAEVLFGDRDCLVAARDLVDGVSVRQANLGGPVTYCHLLFEGHQLIWSEGARSESLNPAIDGGNGLDPRTLREVRALFPQAEDAARIVRSQLTPGQAQMVEVG